MLPGEALRSRARSSLMARLSSPLSSARPPFPATPSPRAPAQAAASSAARPGGGARRGGCLLPAQPHAAATGRRRGRHRGSGAGRGGGARSSWAPAGRVAAAEAAPQAPPCLGRPPGEGGVRCRKQPGLGQDLGGRYGPEEVLLANNHFAELENEGGKRVCLQVWKMQTAGPPPLYSDSITPWLRIKAGFCSSLSG
ncbi:translation initiation factor IF-2-like isoform X1 [Aquila chrysaetos chrysaetos]|uniref:translation initiation factor IF-2-like isoform X1 n=1 Tax=Aquila chrysaetos chrysaetos TaxID=223781 RepID=UPI001B7D2E3F|nr:translation initiation factor IF-2-like isoform X1 [Aquila chrysaetos chrysaetos]